MRLSIACCAVLVLVAGLAAANETVIFRDTAPNILSPETRMVCGPSWEGMAHLASNAPRDGRAKLGFSFFMSSLRIEFDPGLDWGSAALEFHVDPGSQVLKECDVSFAIWGRGIDPKTKSFRVRSDDIGDGKPGFRKVSIPMTKFAASLEQCVGKKGWMGEWLFECVAGPGTLIRVDDVRVVDGSYGLPPVAAKPAPVAFVKRPAVEGGRITFEVSDYCDLAVHVLDAKGKVVRHLAAGVLGDNPPTPLQPKSLSQSLPFDGNGDDGKPLQAGRYTVRVGLRLGAELDRILGEDLDAYTFLYAKGIQVDEKGRVHLLHRSGPHSNNRVWVYDREGKYIEEMMPPNPNRQPSYWNARNGGKQADVTTSRNRNDAQALLFMPGGWFYALAIDHGYDEMYPGVRRLIRVNRDGGGGFWESANLAYWGPLHSEQMYMCAPDDETLLISDGSERDAADAKFCDRPSFFAGSLEWRKKDLKHAVYNCRVDEFGLVPNRAFHYAGTTRLDEPREYLGTVGEVGDGPAHFNGPRGVAVDAQGRIYVCDSGNNKLKFFHGSGLYLGAHEAYKQGDGNEKLPKPSAIAIDRLSGAIYLTVDGPEPPARGKRLLKLVVEEDHLRAVWSVDLNELAGCSIAVDTSTKPTLLWTLFGDGFASFTRVEDLGDRAGKVAHFGGLERWKGMIPCANIAVDAEGNCWSGRALWGHGAYLYKNTSEGRLHVSRPSQAFRADGAMAVGPDGKLACFSGHVMKVDIGGDRAAEENVEVIKLPSEHEHRLRRRGLAIDEGGNFYTVVTTKTPPAEEKLQWHVEKFAPDGSPLAKSCVPGVPTTIRSLAVGKDAGYWLSSGKRVYHYSPAGELRWQVGGFAFGFEERCGCAHADFAVDGNRFAWVCDMQRIGVFVLDANGNQVTRVGSYGNRDCRGKGSDFPLPEVPLGNPRVCVATDEYLWIQDYGHQRIIRCRLGYETSGTVEWPSK